MADAPDLDGKSFGSKTKLFFVLYWSSLIAVTWPLITLPFLIQYWNYREVRCAYVVCMMAVYWVTDVVPMSVTALLPIALYPLLGVLSTSATCSCYMNDTIIMFVGGLVLALAVEHSNLHMRIALRVMTIVGCSHGRIMAGLLFVVSFMSMWISNTAATAMILPIIFALLGELEKEGIGKVFDEVTGPDNKKIQSATKITRAYLMAAAYASTFGGTSTFVGTGTNLTFRGLFEQKFPNYGGLSFVKWFVFAAPQAFVNACLTWLYFQICFFGLFRPDSEAAKSSKIGSEGEAIAKRVMAEKYKNLGSLSFHEACVSFFFICTVMLWLTRDPGFVTGWNIFFQNLEGSKDDGKPVKREQYVLDSTPIILFTILMFLVPKEPQFLHICSKDGNKRPKTSSEGIITWNLIQTRIPWGMMFLLGGGFAISRGGTASGLAKAVGESLRSLENYPPLVIMCFICIFIGFFTEFTSNVGVANLILPVIMEMSLSININPLYLLLPATVMCSYAFRLPVGTPPNALITQYGHMDAKYLLIGGCPPSIYGFISVVITCSTWGLYVYNIDIESGLPSWTIPPNDSFRDIDYYSDNPDFY